MDRRKAEVTWEESEQRREEERRSGKTKSQKTTLRFSNDLWLQRSEARYVRLKVARRCGAKHIYLHVKKLKAPHVQSTFGIEMSKKCTPLWREAQLEVKCVKNCGFGPLWEVEMSKKCTPLWRKAHFEVKMYKAHQVRTTFGSWDVEKVYAVVARSRFRSQES